MVLCSQCDACSNLESNEISSQDPLMTQVIRVDLDKLREQALLAVRASLHQQNWHPMLDNRALFPDHEGSQVGSKHPRADDQVGRLGAGLTDIVMYNKMVVMIDIVMSL